MPERGSTGSGDAGSSADSNDRGRTGSSLDSSTSARRISRRTVLRATGATASALAVGSASAHGDEASSTRDFCAETSTEPRMVPYDEAGMMACSSDHSRSQQLQSDVAAAFEERFPTVGSLVDDGFVPYFDFLNADEGNGVSHWVNPEYLSDESILDPQRPESILVDHRWWRPVGAMFIATQDGRLVDPPPAIYPTADDESGEPADADPCLPWHTHVGLPGRKSWWKYRATHVDGLDAIEDGLPCRTPWMMHVWAVSHPEGVYAHGAPPMGHRGGPPAEPAGFETDAVPGEDDLNERILLDAVGDRVGERFDHLREDVEGHLADLEEKVRAEADATLADIGESIEDLG